SLQFQHRRITNSLSINKTRIMNLINFIYAALVAILMVPYTSTVAQTSSSQAKVLSNGIQLPDVWPPQYDIWQERKSMEVPYLENPPTVIPINTGRQLFVDSFLIAETDLDRVYHRPVYREKPVLEPT